MKHRKLRIAWTAGCGVLCLLLIAFWVRSFEWRDHLFFPITGSRVLMIDSMCGTLTARAVNDINVVMIVGNEWRHDRESVSDLLGAMQRFRPAFRFRWFGDGFAAPHWFAAVVAAVLALIPWIRQITWRFSLRTLLIVATVVAVGLGMIVAAVR
jgi:hypothetical protein